MTVELESAAPRIYDADPQSIDALAFEPRGELVVVYFWGRQCPNCEYFARHLPRLLKALEGATMRLVKVNVYDHPELGTRFGLAGIPAFLLVREGRRLGRMGEFPGYDQWLAIVEDHLPTASF